MGTQRIAGSSLGSGSHAFSRLVVGLIAVVGVAVAACDGSATTESTAAATGTPTPASEGPAAAVATLTDDGCTPNAGEPIVAGETTFTVQNDTSLLASFQLIRLHGTYEEFTEAWAGIRQQEAAGEEVDMDAVLAPFIEEGERIQVEAGESGELRSDVPAGEYAMWCITLDEDTQIVDAWTVGPYTVNDG
jgi:uncharacterized cupredoxin-like copper-binding protein